MKVLRTFACLVAVFGIAAISFGCQSVATTSAKLRNQEGNYDLAINLAHKALAEDSTDAEAYFQLGISYSELDSVAIAYKVFMKSAKLDPTPTRARDVDNNIRHNFVKHYKLGQGAFNRQDYEGAAKEFELATAGDPSQAVGFYNLAVAYSRLAEDTPAYHEKAVTAADRVLQLSNPSDNNYIKALQLEGKELVAVGRPQDAVDRFKRLIEEDPSRFDVIENIGNDLLDQHKWEGAVIFLKMAVEARDKVETPEFNTYYNLGAAYYNLRKKDPANIDRAITYYQKALTLREDEPITVLNIAIANVAKEDYAEATHWLERYTSIKPKDVKGWQLLARCYSETGAKDKARDALRRFENLRNQ